MITTHVVFPAAFSAVTVTLDLIARYGSPEIVPVLRSMLSPRGSLVDQK